MPRTKSCRQRLHYSKKLTLPLARGPELAECVRLGQAGGCKATEQASHAADILALGGMTEAGTRLIARRGGCYRSVLLRGPADRCRGQEVKQRLRPLWIVFGIERVLRALTLCSAWG
jgi:hypothetical protein